MLRYYIRNCIIAALTLVASTVVSQDRPTVGVVLSGGGAKGLAHIGVLQVLEDYGIPVDYIGGTSMGAIIAGMYAVGYSADQLDSIVHCHDLTEILLGDVPRSSTTIRQRWYDEKTILNLTFNEGRLDIPSALSDGQEVFDFLYASTFPHAMVTSFDSLQRPFYCVATDLETGEEVVLREGSLALAMRASAALPTVISPAQIDGRTLVDGGIVNNLPAQEMRDLLGADIVIGVSVEEGLLPAEQVVSITDILGQVTSYGIVEKSRQQYESCDILISPNLAGIGLLSFDLQDSIIEMGRQATTAYADTWIKIGKRLYTGKSLEVADLPPNRRYYRLAKVDIRSVGNRERQYLESHMSFQVGSFITVADINEGIRKIKASDYFESIYYDMSFDNEGAVILTLEPTLKRNYQNTFGTAIHYDNFYGAGLLLQSKRRSFFRDNDQLQLDLVIGNRIRYDLNYYFNQGDKGSLGLRSSYEYNSVNTQLRTPLLVDSSFTIDELIFEYRDFYTELNYTAFKKADQVMEIGAGVHRYSIDSDQLEVQGMSNFAFDDTWYAALESRYYYDDMDARQYPMDGRRIAANAKMLTPFYSYLNSTQTGLGINLDLQWTELQPVSSILSIGVELNVGTNILEAYAPMLYSFATANRNLINRLRPFPGLSAGEAIGESALMFAPMVRWQMTDNIYATGHGRMLWIGAPIDDLVTSQSQLFGASLALGYRSILGPIEVIYGYADQNSELYVNVGYWF